MFFPINNLSTYWTGFYNLYGNDIMSLSERWFNDENIRGRSCKQYGVEQYYAAFYLCTLIKNELDKGYTNDLAYFEEKYNINKVRHTLVCNNISLDKIFTIFGISFNTSNNYGIEGMAIEESFVIEPSSLFSNVSSTINISFLLSNPNYCSSIFNDCITPIIIPSAVPAMINTIAEFTPLPIEECIITGNQCSAIDLTTLIEYIQSLTSGTPIQSRIVNTNIAAIGTNYIFVDKLGNPSPFTDASWIFAGELVCIETSTGNQVGYLITNITASGFTINLVTGTAGTCQGLAVHQ